MRIKQDMMSKTFGSEDAGIPVLRKAFLVVTVQLFFNKKQVLHTTASPTVIRRLLTASINFVPIILRFHFPSTQREEEKH